MPAITTASKPANERPADRVRATMNALRNQREMFCQGVTYHNLLRSQKAFDATYDQALQLLQENTVLRAELARRDLNEACAVVGVRLDGEARRG